MRQLMMILLSVFSCVNGFTPNIELVNPDYVIPHRAVVSNDEDKFAFGGIDGEISIFSQGSWQYFRLPNWPQNSIKQLGWHLGNLIALTPYALLKGNMHNNSWDTALSYKASNAPSFAVYNDSLCFLNPGENFKCSINASTWGIINSYAPNAILFRGSTKWMAIDSYNFYEYDTSWKYYTLSTLGGRREILKTGVILAGSNGVSKFSSSHTADWFLPIANARTVTNPNGNTIILNNDSVYNVFNGTITRREKSVFQLSGEVFFWNNLANTLVPNSNEFKSYTLFSSNDGLTWQRAKGVRSHILSMISKNGKFIGGGDSGTIVTSNDGIKWSESKLSTNRIIRSIIPVFDGIIALSDSGMVHHSADGNVWIDRLSNIKKQLFKVIQFNDTLYSIEKYGIWRSERGVNWESFLSDSTGKGSDLVTDGDVIVYGNKQKILIKRKQSSWDSLNYSYSTLTGCENGVWVAKDDSIYKLTPDNKLMNFASVSGAGGIRSLTCGPSGLLVITADSLFLFKNNMKAFSVFPTNSPTLLNGALMLERYIYAYGMDGRIFRIDLDETSNIANQQSHKFKVISTRNGTQFEIPGLHMPSLYNVFGASIPVREYRIDNGNSIFRIDPNIHGLIYIRHGSEAGLVYAP